MSRHNFHACHAPFGAFASFTCGYASAWDAGGHLQGGFSPGTRHPANQPQFIGWRSAGDAWNLLPFVAGRRDASGDFVGDMEDPDAIARTTEHFRLLEADEMARDLKPASDRFTAGPLSLTIYSPFERIPDWDALSEDARRMACAPFILAVLVLDNTEGSVPLEAIFGIADDRVGMRSLGDTHPHLAGFASGRSYGFATRPGPAVSLRSGMNIFSRLRSDERGLHLLGSEAAIVATAAPGQRLSLPIAIGFHEAGVVTTGIDARYLYTAYFDSLEEVLQYGLDQADTWIRRSTVIDEAIGHLQLSEDQHWLLAHAIHSHLASTQLLQTEDGRPLWVVNEGEYRMLNTFDLAVDHLFFHLHWWPWTVRLTLDLFLERYSYHDRVHSPAGETGPGGLAFTHDMGVDNQFSRPGYSAYELPNLRGCFSYMSAEQLLNWVCCAVTYAFFTGDHDWLAARLDTLAACAESIRNRDDPHPERRDGIIGWDSSRCGPHGSEITTYDSLDVSLGQARNNLYIAVKTLGAWLLLESAFRRHGRTAAADDAADEADRLAGTLAGLFDAEGFFPAVFESGNRSRIIPAVEGLVFPLFLGFDEVLARLEARHQILSLLKRHLESVLRPGVCLTGRSGWKPSSTSSNTWMSKIFLAQYVVGRLCPHLMDPAADAEHRAWMLSATTRRYAFCDQIRCTDGYPLGSRHYPRGVTAWLWTLRKPSR